MTDRKDRRTDSLLRMDKVRERTGLSAATIYRREAAGTFPKRVAIGVRSVAWYESDISDFVAAPMTYRAEAA
ncbi:AlpA family transcriptional regulator [Sphingobium lactosutens]|uniref:helix-turn-helix transcriptional regulator n=1 Tax=Sphingobium lactosutens TaxID=522773 RepID=UPI0015B82A81|nr:AlpA family phage regulatory protein [Sphingobium lactosutens]NWK98685.1 AlpA family transcriptional regulator [Sphingobium lactosutens]